MDLRQSREEIETAGYISHIYTHWSLGIAVFAQASWRVVAQRAEYMIESHRWFLHSRFPHCHYIRLTLERKCYFTV